MTKAEWSLYYDTFLQLNRGIRQPDYMVYLTVSTGTALERIKKRGREYELEIETSYLDNLQASIDEMISLHITKTQLMTIDAENLNLVSNTQDISQFVNAVIEKISTR